MLPAITKRRRVRRASGGRRGGHVGVRRLVKSRLGRPPPRTVPASVRDVAKLLKCYGREFGWRLGRPELAKWAEAFDSDGDGLVSASDVETFAQRRVERGGEAPKNRRVRGGYRLTRATPRRPSSFACC